MLIWREARCAGSNELLILKKTQCVITHLAPGSRCRMSLWYESDGELMENSEGQSRMAINVLVGVCWFCMSPCTAVSKTSVTSKSVILLYYIH